MKFQLANDLNYARGGFCFGFNNSTVPDWLTIASELQIEIQTSGIEDEQNHKDFPNVFRLTVIS